MKRDRTKELFLEQLRRLPIVQAVCEKVGIARSSVYRWRDESEDFRKAFEEALAEGEALLNDLTETQLVSLIQDKNWPAISFWLRHRNPKFREHIEIDATVNAVHELSPEQENSMRRAFKLAGININNREESSNEKSENKKTEENNTQNHEQQS